jgi:hypothetical protein
LAHGALGVEEGVERVGELVGGSHGTARIAPKKWEASRRVVDY